MRVLNRRACFSEDDATLPSQAVPGTPCHVQMLQRTPECNTPAATPGGMRPEQACCKNARNSLASPSVEPATSPCRARPCQPPFPNPVTQQPMQPRNCPRPTHSRWHGHHHHATAHGRRSRAITVAATVQLAHGQGSRSMSPQPQSLPTANAAALLLSPQPCNLPTAKAAALPWSPQPPGQSSKGA